MSLRTSFAKRIMAMLLSGMLVIGLASGSVFASENDVNPDQASEITEEVLAEEVASEASEAPADLNQTSEIAEEELAEEEAAEASEALADPGQTSEISEDVSAEEEATEASEALENTR